MYFIYIILCSDGSLYTGSSNNPEQRFVDHCRGKGAKYTRSHRPLKIIHTESFASRSEALKREIEIKSWKRTRKIQVLKLKIELSLEKP